MRSKEYISIILVMIIAIGCSKKGMEIKNENKNEFISYEREYPDRPINLIIPFRSGGGTDLWNRVLATEMERIFKQHILINNMPGGGPGSIATSYVWDMKHDGYTILGTSETPLTIPVMTNIKSTTKDWEYYIAGGTPGVLCVNKEIGIKSFDEFIKKAKEKPNTLKISSTDGGVWFIQANLIIKYADILLNNITYNGSASAIEACISGQTDAVIASVGEVAYYVNNGNLIPITTIQNTDFEINNFGKVEAITKKLPDLEKYFPLNQFIGFCVPIDTEDEIKMELKKAFDIAMKSDSIDQFAKEQYAIIYNLTGQEAKDFCAKAESSMCWILNDMGLTINSPEEFGINKPEVFKK